ncbi:MAG: hypothetical protein GF355_01540, partial [Candidatus Eisenbacteria bacterium]|nr:hypothetical protein [Candidatus Eisenbacteria bacterium]
QKEGPYEPIFTGLALGTNYFVDDGLAALTDYFYVIAAVDSSGNQGPWSDTLTTNTSPGPAPGWPQLVEAATRSSPTLCQLDGDPMHEILFGSDVVYAFEGDGDEHYDGDQLPATAGVLTQPPGDADAPIWSTVASWQLDGDESPEIVTQTFSGAPANPGLAVLFVANREGELQWYKTLGQRGYASAAIGQLDSDPEFETTVSNNHRIYAFNHDGSGVTAANGVLLDVNEALGEDTAQNLFQTPALADIDGDGLDEVILVTWNGNNRELPPWLVALNGDGSYVEGFPVQLWEEGAADYPKSNTGAVSVADIDGDSVDEPDLELCFLTGRRFWIYEHDGSLRLVSSLDHTEIFGNDGAGLQTPAIGDIDRDGVLDIVFALRTTEGVMLHALRGTAESVTPENELEGFPVEISSPGTDPGSPVLGDVNGDQYPEIIIGDQHGQVFVIDKDGNPVRGFPYMVPGADLRYGGLAIWDVDNDGYNNLVIQGAESRAITTLDLQQAPFPTDPAEQRERNPWPMKFHDSRNSSFLEGPVVTPVLLSGLTVVEEEPGWVRIAFGAAFPGGEIELWRRAPQASQWELRHTVQPTGGGYAEYDLRDPVEGTGAYLYRIDILEPSGRRVEAARFEVEVGGEARRLALAPNHPNPFGGHTVLRFQIPGTEPIPVELRIYDLAGRVVRRLVGEPLTPGFHQREWDGLNDAGRPVGAGLYLVRLSVPGDERERKMLLLR